MMLVENKMVWKMNAEHDVSFYISDPHAAIINPLGGSQHFFCLDLLDKLVLLYKVMTPLSAPPPRDRVAIFAYHYASPEVDREGLKWYSEDGRVGLNQPVRNQDATVFISLNGEIHNREQLFRASCDVELLLHLYGKEGQKMIRSLRGLFAFVLWDSKRKVMLLARDPEGAKPLYYADDGWVLRVASQIDSLLAPNKVSRQEIRDVPAGGFVLVNELGPSCHSASK